METHSDLRIKASRRVSLIAIMTALSLVGNYVFVAVPNVEVGSTILFFTGLVFGIEIAFPCVILMALIYGTINPWGGFIPQIWISQVIGWTYMIIAAQAFRPRNAGISETVSSISLGAVGMFVTLMFDLITNIGYSIAFSVPYYVAIITGIPFMIVHIGSNAIIFATAIPPLTRATYTHLGPQIWDIDVIGIDGEE